MNQKLLALYGLKFAPFSPEVPTEALYLSPKIENFCWRIEQAHLREGGWALIHGYDKEAVMKRRESLAGKNRDVRHGCFPLFVGMYRSSCGGSTSGDAHAGSRTICRAHSLANENGESPESTEVQPQWQRASLHGEAVSWLSTEKRIERPHRSAIRCLQVSEPIETPAPLHPTGGFV